MTYAVLLLALVSGACSLGYESLWLRAAGLVLGNTVEAAAIVMAAFMGGLALGSAAAARLLERLRLPPLRAYAALELGIAGSALLLPRLWGRLPYHGLGPYFGCAFLLLPPTVCMGATFPVLARVIAADRTLAGARLGLLYAVNTAGGVAGLLLMGFWMIPGLGVERANATTALTSALVASAAWFLGRRGGTALAPSRESPQRPMPDRSVRAAGLTAAAVGFVALAFEGLALRVLLLIFGSTTYAFTIMLATYLLGIALGSALVRPWLRQRSVPALAATLALGSLFLLAAVASVDHLPGLYLAALGRLGLTWRADVTARAAVAALFLVPPTATFGAAFPLLLGQRLESDTVERAAGQVLAANTLGAIFGSLAGIFLFLPRLGLQGSSIALSAALLGLALVTLARENTARSRRLGALFVIPLVAVATLAVRPWDQKLLAEGVYMNPLGFFDGRGRVALDAVIAEHRLLHARQGITSTVSILEGEGLVTSFRIDGKVEISDLPADRRLGRMVGHLPMLLNPQAESALNVGFGAGMTVAALAAHPLRRIDVAELEPAVVEAAPRLTALNHGVADDPRLHVVFDDGRHHLRRSADTYDVIASDPFEPTVAGAASLFTREAFADARRHLRPNGLVSQYLPLYELGRGEFDSILSAFCEVFPHVGLWFTGRDALLIGAEQRIAADLTRMAARMQEPGPRRDLEEIGLPTPARLLATHVAELDGGPPPDLRAPPNSDVFPYVEFESPKSRWRPTVAANLAFLLRLRSAAPPAVTGASKEEEREIGLAYSAESLAMTALLAKERGDSSVALTYARRALELDPGQPLATEVFVGETVEAAVDSGEFEPALRALALLPEAALPRLRLAEELTRRNRAREAEPLVREVLARYPRSLRARLLAASFELQQGDKPAAERTVRDVLRDFPDSRVARRALVEMGRGIASTP